MTTTTGREALRALRVEPMRGRHLRGVMAIERRVYPKGWTASTFASELAQHDTRRYLVALGTHGRAAKRRVIGYAGLLLALDEVHVTTVATHPEQHRRKVATHLLLGLLEEAVALGANAATLEVRFANAGAQRLYGQFGFAPVGVRPGYYADTGEDALIMWAHDLQSTAYAERLAGQRARLHAPGGASREPDLHVPWVQGRVGLGDGDVPCS